MKNKKGFLLAEETLKIIIAVICISFLAYFLISLYMKSSADEDLEQAKASLEYLVEEINAGHSPVEIYNPKGWVLSSWGSGVVPLPKSCDNLGWKNCLCICDESTLVTWTLDGLSEDCDEDGFCLENNFVVEGDRWGGKKSLKNSILIEPPLTLKISGDKITK
ncbi:MAG: hypothetical protein V1768_02655 [Patescibacteria group bacterium]